MLVFTLTSFGGLILMHAFVSGNFSVQYVAQHSNTLLPLFYKVTALWGGHEGSLYLWAWILTLYTLVVAWHGRWRYPEHLPLIIAVQGLADRRLLRPDSVFVKPLRAAHSGTARWATT